MHIDGSLRSLLLASWRLSRLLSNLGTAFIKKPLMLASAWASMLMAGHYFRRCFERGFTSQVGLGPRLLDQVSGLRRLPLMPLLVE